MIKLIYAYDGGEELEQEWGTCDGAVSHIEAMEQEGHEIDYAFINDNGRYEYLR